MHLQYDKHTVSRSTFKSAYRYSTGNMTMQNPLCTYCMSCDSRLRSTFPYRASLRRVTKYGHIWLSCLNHTHLYNMHKSTQGQQLRDFCHTVKHTIYITVIEWPCMHNVTSLHLTASMPAYGILMYVNTWR